MLLRVISKTRRYLTIRLSALPGEPTLKPRTWTIAREDLDVMIATKLARPITTWTCPTCASTMSIYEGRIGARTGLFFACSGCETCVEI